MRTVGVVLSLVALVLALEAMWYSTGGHLTASEIGVLAPTATFTAAAIALRIAAVIEVIASRSAAKPPSAKHA